MATKTIVEEFDEDGNLIKRTTTTTEDPLPWSPQPQPMPYQPVPPPKRSPNWF